MRKREELYNQNSCWNKATGEEFLFILLERDPATPYVILTWIKERVRLSKNAPGDEQIEQAFRLACKMLKLVPTPQFLTKILYSDSVEIALSSKEHFDALERGRIGSMNHTRPPS